MNFKDLQDEVKRRATRDQSGTQFDTATKNIINTSLFRIARDAPWRVLRRRADFSTISEYSTGSGAGTFTESSNSITITGATFLTDTVEIGRRIELSGSSIEYRIDEITGETAITLDQEYDGTTTTTGTYEILGQEEYNLPIQSRHRMFMWHEAYNYPYKMQYVTDQTFYGRGIFNTVKGIPTNYRMWGTNMVIEQLREALL